MLWLVYLMTTNEKQFSHELLRPVHNTALHNALCCVAFAFMLVGAQCNAGIDSDPILAFLCVVFLC